MGDTRDPHVAGDDHPIPLLGERGDPNRVGAVLWKHRAQVVHRMPLGGRQRVDRAREERRKTVIEENPQAARLSSNSMASRTELALTLYQVATRSTESSARAAEARTAVGTEDGSTI